MPEPTPEQVAARVGLVLVLAGISLANVVLRAAARRLSRLIG